jgi:hypothetical protein
MATLRHPRRLPPVPPTPTLRFTSRVLPKARVVDEPTPALPPPPPMLWATKPFA